MGAWYKEHVSDIKFYSSSYQEHSQTSLTNLSELLYLEVREMSSNIELAKVVPAIEQQLTYHLLFPGSDGLVLEEMTYEELRVHPSYQLENIADSGKFKSNLKHVSFQPCSGVYDNLFEVTVSHLSSCMD